MPKRDPNWEYHKDDPNWPYDEYGFAKGLPQDHPGRELMHLIDSLGAGFSDEPSITLKDDYTDEFIRYMAQTGNLGTHVEVRTFRVNPYSITFTFYCVCDGKPYIYKGDISEVQMESVSTFNKTRDLLFKSVALIFSRLILGSSNERG